MTLQLPLAETVDWSGGAAYLDGTFMPVKDAKIPITDWGYRRSDVTYDVVSVWDGAFFRLDDHLRRFRASIDALRFAPPETDGDIRRILHRSRARSQACAKPMWRWTACAAGRSPISATIR